MHSLDGRSLNSLRSCAHDGLTVGDPWFVIERYAMTDGWQTQKHLCKAFMYDIGT